MILHTHTRRHPLRVLLIVLLYAWQRIVPQDEEALALPFPLSASVRMRRWIFSNFCVRSSNVFFRHSGFTDPLRFSVVSQRHRRRHVKQNVRMVTERAKRHFQLAAPDAHTSAQWVDTLEVWRERAAASVGRL